MDELTFHKDLVSQWEKAEANLAALKFFMEAGGVKRIRIACEGAPDIEVLVNSLMKDSNGMEHVLRHSTNRAQCIRDEARKVVFGGAVNTVDAGAK